MAPVIILGKTKNWFILFQSKDVSGITSGKFVHKFMNVPILFYDAVTIMSFILIQSVHIFYHKYFI